MDFLRGENRVYVKNDEKLVAEATYVLQGEEKWAIDHTFVSPELRGQGIAEQLVDEIVSDAKKEGKKIVAVCPYVVRLFQQKEEKYKEIMA
jgi:hypothetical protein